MSSETPEAELVQRAVAGDEAALQRLLLRHHDRLAAVLARKLPSDLRATVTADDVLQEAFASAFRAIREFSPRGPDAFFHWLAAIAEHRLVDLARAQRAAKRGGGAALTEADLANDASVSRLLAAAAVELRTPSVSAAVREACGEVVAALNDLPGEYRDAVRLHHLEGLPAAEVAVRMNRTERAVHMLCYRGLQQLRERLGRSSRFLSRKE